jgi:monofunctional biosynthetic peptidoglycan transglycosylase
LRIKGDGQLYNLRFRTNRNFDGVSYQAKFKSEKNNWIEVKIPFSDFIPTFRGRRVPNQLPLDSADILQMGILIADKQNGDFEIIIDWIKFYKE